MARVDTLARTALDDVEAALVLDEPQRSEVLEEIARGLFAVAYDSQVSDDSPTALTSTDVDRFTAQLATALDNTTSEASPATVAGWLSTAAWNAATVASAPPGRRFTWRTQRDDRVRDVHVPMDGITNPQGVPFVVAGVPLRYPGEPIGPPEVWINCRCYLDVAGFTAAGDDDALVARNYDTEQRKAMSDRGTAMPDGSYPIADEEDLRNAIQAIGRAKDPDAVRRHIRKRAKALHLTELIPDSWTAAGAVVDDEPDLIAAPSTSPPGTHDAPGWITHPRETQRLRDYWTKGEGAAKIRWGTPGDLTRCHKYLVKYVGPMWAWSTCNNLHKVATGKFNEGHGRRGSLDELVSGLEDQIDDEVIAAFAAAAQLEDAMLPPKYFFEDPHLDRPTPMQVRGDGEYVGHLASWDVCHVGIDNECVMAPRSMANYAYFRTGEVETDAGPVPVGQITAGTGHAGRDMGPYDTVSHYDDTGTAVADVAVGEDDWGIWAHGLVRPGIQREQIHALRAGAPSGDWRRIAGNLELVGALIVNVPGFPIPRPELLMASGRPFSLTAVGIVAFDAQSDLADKVAAAIERRAADRDRRDRALHITASVNELRLEMLDELVSG
jgi:hypothetical protein